ncbi:hypothetical protein SUGI_0241660 [Cryptomeria japonica]|uniref:LOB domain-containing protein 11-like n=1 Tax=Cryptomeria japonica TaxID=3369 RepID=UPI0024089FBC|nr:LOB domain-containing protein 11-like [Cryptomeria japonica]GLJ14856.1 hypothetical protein SUGI_0241660 [Cryptomeria japonica]
MSGIVYPCAGCKIQHRKCGDKCVLAPFFPPNDPPKFSVVHQVFGASNIVRILKDVPVESRADAVSSMVFEASARVADPIYGCTGEVYRLQKKVLELQSQLESTQAELLNAQASMMSPLTRLSNGGQDKSTLGVTHDIDDIIILQDDEDLFGLLKNNVP